MRKLMLIFLIIFFTSVFYSCEDSFSPKTDYIERYVLHSIVSADINTQTSSITAYLARTYNVDGLNPKVNKIDPIIGNAKLTLTVGNKEYELIVDTTKRQDTSRYNTPEIKYRAVIPSLIPNIKIKIKAVLENNKVLTSETMFAKGLDFEYSYSFNHGITTNLEKWKWGKAWDIFWIKDENHLYFPSLVITYSKLVNDKEKFFTQNIPLLIDSKDGKENPIYPNYTYNPSVSFDYTAIDYAMKNISVGDTNKSAYRIYGAKLSVIEYDQNLSNYYASTNGYLDNFSIRIDETIYNNINGGLGIFGSYLINQRDFLFDNNYIKSFGYKGI